MAWRRRQRVEGMPAGEQPAGKRELLVSRTWLQVAALVIVVGFFVLVFLGYRTYQSDRRFRTGRSIPRGTSSTRATT
jgi:hypothetical protein